MMNRLKLTKRDLEIVRSVVENGFLSFEQVWREFFNGRSRPTVSNRMSRLCRSGILNNLKVSLDTIYGSRKSVSVIFVPTGISVNFLNDISSEKIYALKKQNPLSSNQLYHDLMLSDVIFKLKKDYPSLKIDNATHLKMPNEGKVPDGYVFESGKKHVLEVELSTKSYKRYQDIIVNYNIDKSIDKVFYVYGSRKTRDKILEVILGFLPDDKDLKSSNFGSFNHLSGQSLTGSRPINTGKFYFQSLKKALEEDNMSFVNGKMSWPLSKNANLKERKVI